MPCLSLSKGMVAESKVNYLGLGHRCVQIVERRSLSARGTGKMPILLDATMTVAQFSYLHKQSRCYDGLASFQGVVQNP